MYYCFVSNDFENLEHTDPLFIQSEYAKKIGKYICCDLSCKSITDADGNEISVLNKSVMLRTTCDYIDSALGFILHKGADLIEKPENIEKIEKWESLPVVKRKIFSLTKQQIITGDFQDDFKVFLKDNEKVFIKSRKKGITVKALSKYMSESQSEFIDLFLSLSDKSDENFLCSGYYDIKVDSLSSKEARFFVFDNKIANYSRNVHSVRHTVPKSLISAAYEIVEKIHKLGSFPANYVLDLAEFVDDEQKFIDVVEINPISTSLCYINNSIFSETIPEIESIRDCFQAGNEYCYDFLFNRERYVLDRLAGQTYEYIRTNDYCLF